MPTPSYDDGDLLDQGRYMQFWIEMPDDRSQLDQTTRTLVAHVEALQERIDKLPDLDDVWSKSWARQCACAYDYPTAVCMVHAERRDG